MIRHVVVFKWREPQREATVASLTARLRRLPESIPEILSLRCGTNLHLLESDWDFVTMVDFKGPEEYRHYATHPAHEKLIADLIAPIVAKKASAQIDLTPRPPQ